VRAPLQVPVATTGFSPLRCLSCPDLPQKDCWHIRLLPPCSWSEIPTFQPLYTLPCNPHLSGYFAAQLQISLEFRLGRTDRRPFRHNAYLLLCGFLLCTCRTFLDFWRTWTVLRSSGIRQLKRRRITAYFPPFSFSLVPGRARLPPAHRLLDTLCSSF